MTDEKTLAHINMFAVLGALEELCRLSAEAKSLLPEKPVAIVMAIRDGPAATITLEKSGCRVAPGAGKCQIRLPFGSYAKFNGLFDGTVTPIPSKGFTKLKFLTNNFTGLTDLLSKYLRPSEEDLSDEHFYNASTELMFYVITSALSQIGNNDEVGRFGASYIVDGTVRMAIKNGPAAAIVVEGHRLETVKSDPGAFTASMDFESLSTARRIFDGELNSLACIGTGQVEVRGNLSMLDSMNRILNRVALYLK